MREEPYQAALADLQRVRLEHWALKTRLLALDHEAALLRVRMAERDQRLAEGNLVQAELMKRIDEAAVLNAELSERLRKAGQSVKDLSGEKTELSRALTDTRVKLEDLAKKQAAAEARLAQFKTLMAKFKRLSDEGRARALLRRGQMIVEIPTDELFDPGKTQITANGKSTVGDVARILKTLDGRKFQVAGHTDNIKLEKTTKFTSNWELSTARAVEVTKVLVDAGMEPSSLSAGGFAEFAPAASNDTPDGRKRNRRMEIILVPTAEEIVSMPGVEELGNDGQKPVSPTPKPAN
ncbi:MAG: OmpA family protein [Polyangiaceae bacterium]|nr:OmpA family protein [Polyangiaceae bacterium]